MAAREVYSLLGERDRIAIAYRNGGHDLALADWRVLLDFCDTVFRGKARADILQVNPFPEVQVRFRGLEETPPR